MTSRETTPVVSSDITIKTRGQGLMWRRHGQDTAIRNGRHMSAGFGCGLVGFHKLGSRQESSRL